MTTPQFGVTPGGFHAKRLIDLKNELEQLFIGEFGDVNLDAQSVIGQLIGIYSKVLADVWENLEDVYESQYPNSASGISLDNVVALNGLTRLPAERTTVIGAATGTEGTFLPAGVMAQLTGTQDLFFSTADAFITRGRSIRNVIEVNSVVAPQEYRVVLDSTSYVYSLPIINFSAPLVSGNTVDVRINGINVPQVTYSVSSPATLGVLANAIITNSLGAVASATVVGNTIELVPTLGRQITVNSVQVSGAGAPTYSLTFATPADASTVAQNLSAIIDLGTQANSTWVTPNAFFQIQAILSSIPYSLNVGANLSVTETTSSVPFASQSFGAIAAPAGSLAIISTPVAGWDSITNFEAGVTGRLLETDEELRLRRLQSLRLGGAGTVEAIRARILQEVVGVTSVLIFENVTMTQTPLSVTFSNDFVAGNSAEVILDGVILGIVTFAGGITTHLQMMNAINALILDEPIVATSVVGGVGNRNITIQIVEGNQAGIIFNLSGSGVPTYTVSGGRPPKSFEAVVQGGSDSAVALKIWQTKPAGIETFGNVNNGAGIIIVDSQGQNQVIHFSRATPVYIWVTAVITLNPQQTFPPNGQLLVAQAIELYGNNLGIGIDIFLQQVEAAALSVPGVAGVTIQLARTANPNDTPSYSATDIDIEETQVSVWDLSRITVSI